MATIFCDIDGTLVRKTAQGAAGRHTPKREAINQALADEFGLAQVDFQNGLEHGRTDWQIAEAAVRHEQPEADIDGETWQRVCARAQGIFDPTGSGPDPNYEALPGIPATLVALRAAGHVLGLVTGNISFFAYDKLVQAGIDRGLFTGPHGFGDHGRQRYQIVRLAMARAPRDAALVVLGDTLHDLEGARRAELPFLGVGTTGLKAADLAGIDQARWVADLSTPPTVLAAIDALLA